MPKRVVIVVVAALAVAAVTAYVLRPPRGVPDGAPTESAMAQTIGTDVMLHLYRGHVPGRSGEIMLVPQPHDYLIGDWDLTTLGSDTPTLSTSHPNPWSYLARVPIIFYGDGVPRGKEIDDSVDITGVAASYARILGVSNFTADSGPFPIFAAGDGSPPKAIVTLIMDGGGWDALQEHADAWPNIQKLRDNGTTFINATIGSAPSITGALHATFGTGQYPIHHGIPGNQMRSPNGENTDTWLENADPRYLEVPALADVWDKDKGNKPVIATVAYEGWHLGMIGHGAAYPGGDKDVAVLWDSEKNAWWINEDFYSLPSYLQQTELGRLESYERGLDARDGVRDGTWFGHTLEELQQDLVRPGTPAFVRFTGDASVDVLKREGIGQDSTTDMLWIEMKAPDYAGHAWNVLSAEEGDVLREVDTQIGRIIKQLNATVGKGNYLFTLSADHGQQPLPDLLGGWRINSQELERDLNERFGDVVEKVTPVDIYFDHSALADKDVSLDDVARYLGTYTIADNIPESAPGSDLVPKGRLDETLFAGAFTSDFLTSLTDDEIASFGDGDYEVGDLTSPPTQAGANQIIP